MQKAGVRAIARVGVLVLVASAGCGSPEAREDVPYDDRFGEATTMDVYLPDGAGARPGVMFIHGGGWAHGSKAEYTEAAKRLARSGYVAATINYRLVPEVTYPKGVQDCVCALSYLRAHAAEYRLDPNRIAVMGYSAGGHLASLLGVATEAKEHAPDCAAGPTKPPAAIISGAGPQDFRGRDDVPVIADFLGGTLAQVPDRYVSASPAAHVRPNLPPYLFISGTADWFVSVDQSRDMRDALVSTGNDARVLEVTGGGHLVNAASNTGQLSLGESDLTQEGWIAVMDFLERTVGRP